MTARLKRKKPSLLAPKLASRSPAGGSACDCKESRRPTAVDAQYQACFFRHKDLAVQPQIASRPSRQAGMSLPRQQQHHRRCRRLLQHGKPGPREQERAVGQREVIRRGWAPCKEGVSLFPTPPLRYDRSAKGVIGVHNASHEGWRQRLTRGQLVGWRQIRQGRWLQLAFEGGHMPCIKARRDNKKCRSRTTVAIRE